MSTTILNPQLRDLGGFSVRRVLPAQARKTVGPFIFFDHFGPTDLAPGQGLDVRPHPHIGLATVTYLFDGAIQHKDSLGSDQPIVPGDVNWMTAGQGIVHSERTGRALRATGSRLYGIQSWVALPRDEEGHAPNFAHHARADLPVIEEAGFRLRLIAGEGWGARSPVETLSALFYADAALEPGAVVPLPAQHEERAAYLLDGEI